MGILSDMSGLFDASSSIMFYSGRSDHDVRGDASETDLCEFVQLVHAQGDHVSCRG